MTARVVIVTLLREGNMCAVPVPFDPKAVFGRVRAPVLVTLNGYTYRSTISSMAGETWIPLRKSNREAAGLLGDETLEVRIELDAAERTVEPPADLAAALRAAPPAWDRWQELSVTHQREWAEAVDEAKRPETRARRIARAVAEVGARKPKARKG
jgi:hypothetical protein